MGTCDDGVQGVWEDLGRGCKGEQGIAKPREKPFTILMILMRDIRMFVLHALLVFWPNGILELPQDWGTTGTYIVAGTSIDEAVRWVMKFELLVFVRLVVVWKFRLGY